MLILIYLLFRIKLEPLDEDANHLQSTDETQARDIKVEIQLDYKVENNNPDDKTYEGITETDVITTNSNLSPEVHNNKLNDLPNGFEKTYLNGMLDKQLIEGHYTEVLNNTFNNYFNTNMGNTSILNVKMNCLTNNLGYGISNLISNDESETKNSKGKVQSKSKKNKTAGVLEKLYKASLLKTEKLQQELDNSAPESKSLFNGKIKVVDVIATPEIKEEGFFNDSDDVSTSSFYKTISRSMKL